MSHNKHSMEGLTVRIWDPVTNSNKARPSTNASRGNRGYRQYTEQIGSERLAYSTHKTEEKVLSTATMEATANDVRTSNRNWRAEKQEKVQDLPLVSRAENQHDSKSLKNVNLQYELWQHIRTMASQLKHVDDKKEWQKVVDLFRKLREGVYATKWSHGNIKFSVQVYQESVNAAVHARDYGELLKSLSGLNELYAIRKDAELPYYTVIELLYHCCYIRNSKSASDCLSRLDNKTNEGIWGKELVHCMFVTKSPIQYFKLYQNNPYPAFKNLMENHNDVMRKRAIQILRLSYLSTSIEWAGKCIGVTNNNELILNTIEKLVQPSCIKSVDIDRQIVHFSKR